MFLGGAAMRTLVLDRGDDAGLAIVEFDGLDARLGPQLRPYAVAGDKQSRLADSSVRERDSDGVIGHSEVFGSQALTYADAQSSGGCAQGADKRHVGHHVGEGFAGFRLVFEGQENRPDRVAGFRIGDHHPLDWFGFGQNPLPDAQDVEHARGSRRDCRGALILFPALFRGTVNDGNVEVRRRCLDGDRQ